jgi:hypothetical protein
MTRRAALIGITFVVASIFATAFFASAASISLTGTMLGANTTSVAACDPDGLDVAWVTSYSSGVPGYVVTSVDVSDIHGDCVGATLTASLSDSGGNALGSLASVTVSGTSHSLTVTGTVEAEDVENASVIITGP